MARLEPNKLMLLGIGALSLSIIAASAFAVIQNSRTHTLTLAAAMDVARDRWIFLTTGNRAATAVS